jgi:hypothetical protein
MRIRWLPLLAAAALGLFLSACTLPSDAPPPVPGGGPTAVPTTVYPDCDPALLIQPSLVFPVENTVVSDLTPLFEWASPGYVIENPSEPDERTLCKTDAFNLYLSSGPFFQDESVEIASGVPGFDSFYTVVWTPDTDLKPGTAYRWYVAPVSQSTEGQESEVGYFFTGPVCEADSLEAPVPVSPPNHWTTDDLGGFTLYWDYPGECVPDGYEVDLSNSLDLDNSPLNMVLDTPGTSTEIGALLQDCQRYYWRVRAVSGGEAGQSSQLFTFTVDLSGTCAPETATIIHGTLWEDQCDASAGSDPMPLGCVLNQYDMLFTNQTYDPGEPGIGGAVITLAQGACPSSTILRAVPTFGDGTYDFYQLNAETYCVGLDLTYAWNNFLIPGTFTFPADFINEMAAEQTVVLSPGEKADVDFGWWYAYGNGWGETTGSVFGMVWHDMCAYTPGDPEPDPLPVGCALDQWGVIHGDGERLAHEPGIPGVVVDLGLGDCPSSGYATAITDFNGVYHFNDLPAGDYCLRIDPVHGSSNEAILMPGSWTVIPSGHENMTFRAITIQPAKTLYGQDFGWDYDNLPSADLISQSPILTLEFNANCRKGPSLEHEVSTFGLAGQAFTILGRNEENNWFLVRFNEILECWFSRDAGAASGDLGRLEIFTGPPLLSCSDHKDQSSCVADSKCKWMPTIAAMPYCTDK